SKKIGWPHARKRRRGQPKRRIYNSRLFAAAALSWRSSSLFLGAFTYPVSSALAIESIRVFHAEVALELVGGAGLNDVALVVGVARLWLDVVIRRPNLRVAGGKNPRLAQHDRVLNGGLVFQVVALAGPALDHMFFVAVDAGQLVVSAGLCVPGLVV